MAFFNSFFFDASLFCGANETSSTQIAKANTMKVANFICQRRNRRLAFHEFAQSNHKDELA